MSEVVSTEELRSHLACPRQYEYEHTLDIATDSPDDANRERLDRLYRTIGRTIARFRDDVPDEDRVVEYALAECRRVWNGERDDRRPELVTRYDEAVAREALRTYFRGDGYDHLRRVEAIGEPLAHLDPDLGAVLVCPDVLVFRETEGGTDRIGVVKYLTTLSSIGLDWFPDYIDYVEEHQQGEGFWPRRVAAILEGAIALRAARRQYEADRYTFSYLAVENEVTLAGNVRTDDRPVSVRPARRAIGDQYGVGDPEAGVVLRDEVRKILGGAFSVPDSRWDAIRENACEYCTYREMCEEYIGAEVMF
jgi:hypothetical protein